MKKGLSLNIFGKFLQVDSANKRGSLLEVVQVLNDLNLIVRRAYISSDGEWFMDGELSSSNFCICALNFCYFVTDVLVLNGLLCSVSCH